MAQVNWESIVRNLDHCDANTKALPKKMIKLPTEASP